MAERESINLVLVTPERQVLEERVDSVVIPAHDGELGILRDRAALMCELGIGQLRYSRGGQTWRVFIDGGFAQVLDNHVAVLTNQALPAEAITPETIAAAEHDVASVRGHDPEAHLARAQARRRLSALRRLQPPRHPAPADR